MLNFALQQLDFNACFQFVKTAQNCHFSKEDTPTHEEPWVSWCHLGAKQPLDRVIWVCFKLTGPKTVSLNSSWRGVGLKRISCAANR